MTEIRGKVNQAVFDSIWADPANDNYHYFRGSDYDREQKSILERYSLSISLVSCMKLSFSLLKTSSIKLCFNRRLIHRPPINRQT